MGWWKINEIEDNENTGLYNALPNEDKAGNEYSGDGPADIMDNAIELIITEYNKTWGRAPTRNEIIASFEFSLCDYGEEHD